MRQLPEGLSATLYPSFSGRFIAERLDFIYRSTPLNTYISLLGAATAFFIVSWNGLSQELLVWLGIMGSIVSLRHLAYSFYPRQQGQEHLAFWWHLLLVISTVHGFAWGLLAIHPFNATYHLIAIMLPLLVGIGAVISYGSFLHSYCCFCGGMFFSLTLGTVWINRLSAELFLPPILVIGTLLFLIGKNFERKIIALCEMQVKLYDLNTALQATNASLRSEIAERKRTEQALVESEYRFRRVVNTAPIMIWLLGGDQGSMELNVQAQDFLGLQATQISYGTWCAAMHPLDKVQCQDIFDAAVAKQSSFEREYRLRSAQREYRWVLEHGVPRFTPDGVFVGYIGTCTDITERHESERARLQEAITQRQLLVREVHHRIKNHLQGLVGLLEQFETKCPEGSEFFQQAAAQTNVIAIIHGLQAQSGTEESPIVSVITAIVETLQRLTGVPIEFRNSESLPGLYLAEASSVPIALVINELLLNAIKHGHYAGNRTRIVVSVDGTPKALDVRVINPGPLKLPTTVRASTGLGLVRLLLPREGASLDIALAGEYVEATLRLTAPVLLSTIATQEITH